MSSIAIESLVQGGVHSLTSEQLTQLEARISTLGLPLDRPYTQQSIYKISSQQACQFMQYIEKYQLTKTIYNDFQHQQAKIKLYNTLAGFMITKATKSSSKQQCDLNLSEVRRYLNLSEAVKMSVEQPIRLTRGYLLFASGSLGNAYTCFSKVFEQTTALNSGASNTPVSVIGILGLAQVYFFRKNYVKALDLFKRALELNKGLPSKARLGMAYCFYYCEKYELARACFRRILKLDANCVEAILGLAVLCEKDGNESGYFELLRQAYLMKPDHPLILLHLAEHALFRGDLETSRGYCQAGLKDIEQYSRFIEPEEGVRNDYQELKARFKNLLGQGYHIRGEWTEAAKYYKEASGKGLAFNELLLAFTHLRSNSQNYVEALRLIEIAQKSLDPKQHRLMNDIARTLAYLRAKVSLPPGQQSEMKDPASLYGEAIKYNKDDFQAKIQLCHFNIDSSPQKALNLLVSAEQSILKVSRRVREELLNNIGVLLTENNRIPQGRSYIEKCLKQLKANQEAMTSTGDDELRRNSLALLADYNMSVILEKENRFSEAKQILKEILARNKYFIDAYVRLALLEHYAGNNTQAFKILTDALEVCSEKSKILRLDKIQSLQVYLYALEGSPSQAKETLRRAGKSRDLYAQLQELAVGYELVLRKGADMVVMKDFLRPHREFLIRQAQQDPHNAFVYMCLVVLLATDKKISRKQGLDYFEQLKQFAKQQAPALLYNLGLFLINYEDYPGAISALTQSREGQAYGEGTRRVEALSLAFLLNEDFPKSLVQTKRCIMLDPSNLRHRFQLWYTVEKQWEKTQKDRTKLVSEIAKSYTAFKKCGQFYAQLQSLSISDYLKGINSVEFRERTRGMLSRIRSLSQERRKYVKSSLQFYERCQREAEQRQRSELQFKLQNLQELKKARLKAQEGVQRLLGEDSEEERKRDLQDRKRQALELARKRQQEMNSAWDQIKVNEEGQEKTKRKKKNATEPGEKPVHRQKKQQRLKGRKQHMEQQDLPSDEQESIGDSIKSEPRSVDESQSESQQRVKVGKRLNRHSEDEPQIRKRLNRIIDDEESGGNPFEDPFDEPVEKPHTSHQRQINSESEGQLQNKDANNSPEADKDEPPKSDE